MRRAPAIQPAWTIARSMWLAQRSGFLALMAAALAGGLLLHWLAPLIKDRDLLEALGYLPMGLSLFLTFVLCGFTETDRRGRGEGFPARLFTLPVNTRTLIFAPIFFSVAMVGIMYIAWSKFALPALGRDLPLSWPLLYLATGMTCYQAIVWSLARFRLARLLVLGVGGTLLAVGWDAFRDGFEREIVTGWLPIPDTMPVRPVLCGLLVVLSLGAVVAAQFAVESQRRGGGLAWPRPQRLLELALDVWPRRRRPLRSPAQAQFWYEWRRHGLLLPLTTTMILLVIMLPASLPEGGLTAAATQLNLGLILLVPLLLAFALGKGFGKADLWSKEPALPVFFATRPLSGTALITAKLRAAALAALITWVVLACLTAWWFCLWGDGRDLIDMGRLAGRIYPATILCTSPLLILGVLILLTWRLLVGSLYLGMSGKNWLLTTAVCCVFTLIFGIMFLMLWLNLHPKAFKHLFRLPVWLPWVLAGLFMAKAGGALLLAGFARRQGWVTSRSIFRYLQLWLGATAFISMAVWLLFPVDGWIKWLLIQASFLAMPLVSMAYAPIALARNRSR